MFATCSDAPTERSGRAEGESTDFPRSARKPDGGFRFVPVMQLVMAWWAYRERFIRFLDLRVYWAAHEVLTRRSLLEPGQRSPTYEFEELRRLTGAKHTNAVRHAVRRLEKVGLLRWGSERVTLAVSPDELRVENLSGFWETLQVIENRRRQVPVPRRTLRLLAGGARRAVAATVLGHLLRCVYYRAGQCSFAGSCKSSWVATVFGIDERKAKEARAHLRAIGWLKSHDEKRQWYLNRYGARCVVNARWEQDGSNFSTTESAPLELISTTESAPPDSDQNPLRERYKNQKPARTAGPDGLVSSKKTQKKDLPQPTLRDVLVEDLRDTERLLELREQAQRQGLVGGGEAARLNFVGAAEHALAIGSVNPAGLFVRLVRSRLWHFITQADEDAARLRLKRHDFGCDGTERLVESEPTEAMHCVRANGWYLSD